MKQDAAKMTYGKSLVNITHGGSKLIAGEEEADGNGLSPYRRPIHYLVFGYCLVLVEDVRACDSQRMKFLMRSASSLKYAHNMIDNPFSLRAGGSGLKNQITYLILDHL